MELNTTDLRKHVLEITNNMINQIDSDNVIHCWVSKQQIQPDAVANHHLIDLLSELNSNVFWHYCNSLFNWLSDEKNGYADHPFTLDSYTKFCTRNDENAEIIKKIVASHQYKDGRFTIYTALVGGGDFFSTLWATKILINYDKLLFQNQIELAFEYLIADLEIGAQTTSQKGFLLFLLLKYNPKEYEILISQIQTELFPLLNNISFTGNIIESINELYLIEDFIELYKSSKDISIFKIVIQKTEMLFSLDKDFDFPTILKEYSTVLPQSPYYQFLLKSALIGTKILMLIDDFPLDLELNTYLHFNYRQIKYAGIEVETILKKYKRDFGEIEEEFQEYDDDLKTIWSKSNSDYEHSIFLMMPFKDELNYRTLTDKIKEICKKHGFKAFRVDDRHRSPYDILWNNIVINMLSCKYGISVHVNEKTADTATDELKFFQNPNVALEYGFMKSRGKKLLILKDKNSITPSDLGGFLWKPFDITNPDKSVPTVLSSWLKELKVDNN